MKQLITTIALLFVAFVATAQYVNTEGPTSDICECKEYKPNLVTKVAYGDQPFVMLDLQGEFLYECAYYSCSYNVFVDECDIEYLDNTVKVYNTEYGDFTLYVSPDCESVYKYEREFEGTLYSYSY